MSDLFISFALPNPAGKDRTPSHQVTNGQLNGEWIEFAAARNVSIQGVVICHQTYDAQCRTTGEDQLTSFRGSLTAGQSIRIHTGPGSETWIGNVLHTYLGRRNFVWNNRCGDAAILRNSMATLIDWASYAPNPPEGAILQRQMGTNQLIVSVFAGR